MVMQKPAWAAAFLAQVGQILEGVWNLSLMAGMKYCGLFLLKQYVI